MHKYHISLAALAEIFRNLVHCTRGFIFLNFDLKICLQKGFNCMLRDLIVFLEYYSNAPCICLLLAYLAYWSCYKCQIDNFKSS
jgi:hypothetical protein